MSTAEILQRRNDVLKTNGATLRSTSESLELSTATDILNVVENAITSHPIVQERLPVHLLDSSPKYFQTTQDASHVKGVVIRFDLLPNLGSNSYTRQEVVVGYTMKEDPNGDFEKDTFIYSNGETVTASVWERGGKIGGEVTFNGIQRPGPLLMSSRADGLTNLLLSPLKVDAAVLQIIDENTGSNIDTTNASIRDAEERIRREMPPVSDPQIRFKRTT